MILFLKKNWSTLLLLMLLALLFIPQTGTPIKVFFNRVFAFSPSEIEQEDREQLTNYNWELRDLKGVSKNFKSSDGSVVVLNIWATWCPPCIAEMPSFQELYNDYGTEVDFYFVSLEDAAIVQRFVTKKGYDFPVFTTQNQFPKELATTTYPTTYVISKSGAIAMEKSGAADWNSDTVRESIDRLLSE